MNMNQFNEGVMGNGFSGGINSEEDWGDLG